MTELSGIDKLTDMADRAEIVQQGRTGLNATALELYTIDKLVQEALPLLAELGIVDELKEINELLRRKAAGIKTEPWQWVMEMSMHLRSACVEYGHIEERRARVLRAQEVQRQSPPATSKEYVSASRIAEIRSLQSSSFDFSKVLKLCEEINVAHQHDCHIAVAALVRTMGDHIPPLFGATGIAGVAGQITGRSVKRSLEMLATSMKHIADHHLHDQISPHVSLPTDVQVNCSREFDVLLSEVVKKAKNLSAEHS